MYQEVHTENIVARAHAKEIAEILHHFTQHARDEGGAPHEAFCDEVLPQFGEDIMVLAPTGDGDYAYVHYGREITRYVGGSRLGERISSMTPQVARFTAACYDQALSDGKPAYTVHRSLKTVRVCLWERLVMPTTARNGERFLVVFSRPLQFHEELLTTVLETSPSGIVALRVMRDDRGDIIRTMIITANQRAAVMAGRGDENLHDTDARESLPFLADAMIWRRCLYAIELRRSDMIETSFNHGDRVTWLQIAIAPLGDGLVMTMTDVSELMVANQTLQSRAATLALEIGRERATRRALSQEIGQREEREQELRRLAETDPLTALLNRRSFIEKANDAIAACDASGDDTSLIIVDLDHFKSVNDSHGHAAGDAVIRAFADLLLGTVRSDSDLVGRFGGEEFAVFLPRANAATARRMAQRMQHTLETKRLPVSETLALQVSASFGIATRQKGENFTAFIERADRALYRAKNDGRDCIRLAEPALVTTAAAAA
ncbi:GGDEF domain-containing protein [Bosea sp. LjRoot9]|uniref:GGDEF domain-containing protein n=1 Tax=Bosea sp. LjRoot9 TaxID=3342341 RepID=UPI003ED0A643